MARKNVCPKCGASKCKCPATVWDDDAPEPNHSVVGMEALAGVMKSLHSALIQNTMHMKILGEQIDRLADILAPMSAGYQRDTAPKPIAKTPVQSSEPSNRASKLELD